MRRISKDFIAIIVILIVSICISTPKYIKENKKFKEIKAVSAKEWIVYTPEARGMDPKKLKAADSFVGKTHALSLLVIRNGSLVFENYYNGGSEEAYNNSFSVTKSIISALVGIALDKGYIKSLDEKIITYFPEYALQIKDSRKEGITIKHLLTMTPGFIEEFNQWLASEDWVKYTFDLPLKYNPGEHFQYANSASHLLSVILTKATGMKTEDFAEKYLFNPLDIKDKTWLTDPKSFNTGHANLFLRPRDMAKFGQLYLNKGIWKGKRIIPEYWIEESTKKHVDTDTSKTKDTPTGYGYKWWTFNESGYGVYIAAGYGGQNICVIPELDILVITTSIPERPDSFNDEDRSKLLNNFIIPAVKEKMRGVTYEITANKRT